MHENPVFALMFAGYLTLMFCLLAANILLMVLRMHHRETGRLAVNIRRLGQQLWFLRLGDGHVRRAMRDRT